MLVSGTADLVVSIHAIKLETDAVEVDEYGDIIINDPDKFFDDWMKDFDDGCGELPGVVDEKVNLHTEADE